MSPSTYELNAKYPQTEQHTHTTNKQKFALTAPDPRRLPVTLLTWRICCDFPHRSLTCENQGWISRKTSRKGDNFAFHSCFLVASPLSQEAASLYVQSLSSLTPFPLSLSFPPKLSFSASNQPLMLVLNITCSLIRPAFSCFLSCSVSSFERVLWKYPQIHASVLLQFLPFAQNPKKFCRQKARIQLTVVLVHRSLLL